jgi:hypothetical protein
MRKLMTVAVCGLMACAAMAAPRYIPFEVSIGTNAAEVVTDAQAVGGMIEEVYLQAPAALVTANVSVVSAPAVGTGLTETVLYTNGTLTAAAIARPRVTQTDNEGANLSSLTVAERFLCVGDTVTFTVDQVSAQTGLTFKCWIKVK